MTFNDLRGLLRKSALTVQSVENPFPGYWRITLLPSAGTKWTPGEHGIFTLPEKQIKGRSWRAFSVASTRQEGVLIIGTRTGDAMSGFKKELISLKPGDRVNVRGPFGWFKVKDDTSPIVMAAGGVGITPVRALTQQLRQDTARPIELVYEAKEYHLFGDELQAIAAANPVMNIRFTKTREESQTALLDLILQHKNEARYYISGPPGYIRSNKKWMKEKGVQGKRIVTDPFFGY